MRCIAVLVWCSALVLTARPAEAVCLDDGQGPCYRYWHSDLVLFGEVTDKVLLSKGLLGGNYRLRVTVLEGFRGVGPAESSITIHARDGECGVFTPVGKRMFVYADREDDGAFWASMHSMPLESAEPDLAYARLASKNAASTMVYGAVVHRDDAVVEVSGVTVRVRGEGFDARTTSDAEGNYSIRLPGAGRYEVDVMAPGGMANRDPMRTRFELVNAQECFHVGFQLLTDGRIRGVVIDERNGRPVPNLVLGTGDYFQKAKTDRAGAFDIGPVSEGHYRLEAFTGGDVVTFVPGAVTMSSGQVTVVRPLVARFSRKVTSVTFDLRDLPVGGWIELPFTRDLKIGQEKEATIALEIGVSLDIFWWTGKEKKGATLKVDEAVSRVKLSQLEWRLEP